MTYYDIHTHQPSLHPEDVAIVNTLVARENVCAVIAPIRSVGIHPWYISDQPEVQISELKSLLTIPGVVAIGEVGLDKLAGTPLKRQQEIFKTLAALAESVGMPLLIHCVKAWDELIEARKEINPHVPWIIHGFRGNGELARQLLRQDFFLSFGQYFNPGALLEAWPDRMFAETDDRPVDIRFVYRQIAQSLGLPTERVLSQLAENVSHTFPGL